MDELCHSSDDFSHQMTGIRCQMLGIMYQMTSYDISGLAQSKSMHTWEVPPGNEGATLQCILLHVSKVKPFNAP